MALTSARAAASVGARARRVLLLLLLLLLLLHDVLRMHQARELRAERRGIDRGAGESGR